MSEELPTINESPVTASEAESGPAVAVVGTEGAAGSADDGTTSAGARAARRRAHRRRNTIEWVVVLAGALVIAIVIKTFLFQAFYIPSDSMEPTLKVGDRVLVNKLSYRLHDVNDGDIVVFDRPSTSGQTVQGCNGQGPVIIPPSASFNGEEVKDLIKRVIATEGQTVEQRGGQIYVNGQLLNEPYVHKTNGVTDKTPAFHFQSSESSESARSPQSAQCITVPQGKVFVLGDNRQDSNASNMFGPIPASSIVGRAFVRVWPPSSIGGI